MEWQLRGFREYFGDIMEFNVLQATYEYKGEPWKFMTDQGW
jgi:hypothetical protein